MRPRVEDQRAEQLAKLRLIVNCTIKAKIAVFQLVISVENILKMNETCPDKPEPTLLARSIPSLGLNHHTVSQLENPAIELGDPEPPLTDTRALYLHLKTNLLSILKI